MLWGLDLFLRISLLLFILVVLKLLIVRRKAQLPWVAVHALHEDVVNVAPIRTTLCSTPLAKVRLRCKDVTAHAAMALEVGV